ncbi:MAG TPA: GntR family transcriptional regulator [Solirubrobacteraceae bacterium]|nr:GntR family transcriptional regulator [Solirubrobacteraceae bacterium]
MSTNWGLGSVERRSTTDQVLYELRAAILAGRIKPSEQLPEAALAQTFGTGRSAIREAIRHLVQEGLVVSEHNRGARVRSVSAEDIYDVYVAREAIEVAAAQHAIERQDQLDLSALQVVFERIVGASPADLNSSPSPELIAADLDFHREMVALAGSPRLSRAYEPLAAESQILLNWHPDYSGADYVGDHSKLVHAFESRDPNIADIARAHLRLTSQLLLTEAGDYARRLQVADNLVPKTIGASSD